MNDSDKKTPSNEGLGSFVAFLQKNIKYIAGGVLLLLLVFLLFKFSGSKGQDEITPQTEATQSEETGQESETYESYQVDANQQINDLISGYYATCAAGDIDGLAAFVAPVSDNEKSYIRMFSNYVEEYRNIHCYTKAGLEDGSYMVSAYVELKFVDVDTVAPSLDFFYVRPNGNGGIYIDNVYSQYNDAYKEFEKDAEIQARIEQFEGEDDVLELKQEVWEKYNGAKEADENLNTMLSSTLIAAVAEWKTTHDVNAAETSEKPESGEEPAEQSEAPEEPEQNDTPQETKTLYAKERVRVRAEASTESEVLGNLEMGAGVTATGTSGEWTVIEFEGKTGYVKSEFLSENAESGNQTASNEGTASGSLAEGKVIRVTGAVNIRASMSETADKIGTAFDGEEVTVIMSYAEGWTKVSWNGKTGYIKTDLLQ